MTVNTNAFRDIEELLAGDPAFWVLFTEEIDNRSRDEVHKQSGIYHWLTDIYCFLLAEERCLAFTFGPPSDCEWFYTTDPALTDRYRKVLVHLYGVLGDLDAQNKRDGL